MGIYVRTPSLWLATAMAAAAVFLAACSSAASAPDGGGSPSAQSGRSPSGQSGRAWQITAQSPAGGQSFAYGHLVVLPGNAGFAVLGGRGELAIFDSSLTPNRSMQLQGADDTWGIASSPDGMHLYIATDQDRITVIRTDSLAVEKSIDDVSSTDLTPAPDGRSLYACDPGLITVKLATGSVATGRPSGCEALAVSGTNLFTVSTEGEDDWKLTKINTEDGSRTAAAITGPYDSSFGVVIAVAPAEDFLLVSITPPDDGNARLLKFDARTLALLGSYERQGSSTNNPGSVAITPDGRTALWTDASDVFDAIETATMTRLAELPKNDEFEAPIDIAAVSDTLMLAVTDNGLIRYELR